MPGIGPGSQANVLLNVMNAMSAISSNRIVALLLVNMDSPDPPTTTHDNHARAQLARREPMVWSNIRTTTFG
jgi:hypothetical protein